LNRFALNVSACCSTLSFTIFQKQSLTAKLKFRVVVCVALNTPSLQRIKSDDDENFEDNFHTEIISKYEKNLLHIFEWIRLDHQHYLEEY